MPTARRCSPLFSFSPPFSPFPQNCLLALKEKSLRRPSALFPSLPFFSLSTHKPADRGVQADDPGPFERLLLFLSLFCCSTRLLDSTMWERNAATRLSFFFFWDPVLALLRPCRKKRVDITAGFLLFFLLPLKHCLSCKDGEGRNNGGRQRRSFPSSPFSLFSRRGDGVFVRFSM